jgi:hypothetical protein
VHGTASTEVLEQRREKMLREAEVHHLEKALQTNLRRPFGSRWTSRVAWELAKAVGLLREFFETPENVT